MVRDCKPEEPKMRFFLKGYAEMFILSETADKPSSGKEMMDEIMSMTEGMWCPSPGATYPVLRKMEKEGLIKSTLAHHEGRREILYSATVEGRKTLEAHRKHMAEKSEKMFRLMMPLMLRILKHRKTDVSRKLAEVSDLIMWNRTYMFSLSDEKLEPELDRMIVIFKKLKKERGKTRLGDLKQ